MAVNDSTPAEEAPTQSESESSSESEADSTTPNPIVVAAVRKGVAAQASRQQDFQEFVRTKTSADAETATEFQKALVGFISTKLEDGEVSMPEAAIALFEELDRMESQVQKASEAASQQTNSTQEASAPTEGDTGRQDLGFQ